MYDYKLQLDGRFYDYRQIPLECLILFILCFYCSIYYHREAIVFFFFFSLYHTIIYPYLSPVYRIRVEALKYEVQNPKYNRYQAKGITRITRPNHSDKDPQSAIRNPQPEPEPWHHRRQMQHQLWLKCEPRTRKPQQRLSRG